MSGVIKAQIRAAVYQHCQQIKAPQSHYKACLDDIWQEPEPDWLWYLQYFKEWAA